MIARQTSGRAIRIVSQCATTEEFVAVFHPYLERDGLFIATGTPEELGGSIRFVMTLASGEPILRGEAQVVESHHDKGNFYGLRGMKVRFASLDRGSEQTLQALQSGPSSRVSKATASRSLVECIIYDEPGSDAAEPLSSSSQVADSPDSSPGVPTPGDADDDVTAVAQSPNKPPAAPVRPARTTAIPPIPRPSKPPEPPTLRDVEMLERDQAGFAVPRPMSESDQEEDAGDLPVASDDEATETAPAEQLRSAALATRNSTPRARPPISDSEVTMQGTPPPELMARMPQAPSSAGAAADPTPPTIRAQGKPPLAVPDDATIKMPSFERDPSAAPPPAPPLASPAVHPSVEVQSSDLVAGQIASGEISSGEVSPELSPQARHPSVAPGAEPRPRPSSQQPPLVDRHNNSASYKARGPSQPGAERPRRRPVVEIATPTEIVSPLSMQAPAATGQGPAAPPRPETVRAGQVRTAAVSATFGALLGLAAGYFLWGFDQDNQAVQPTMGRPAGASVAIDARPAPAVIADAAPAPKKATGPSHTAKDSATSPPDAATAAAAAAVLELTSAPNGAEVTVDGVVIGRTPIEHPVTGDGPFEIVVTQRGYRPWTRTLDIGYLAEPIHAQLRRARKRRR